MLTVVGRGATIEDARTVAYRSIDRIMLEGAQFRTDIGLRET
ncbi:MAG: phosphoribosylglycinamide synthetase C domain-containing protein [Chloroflexia bacterium]